jgi:aryl-alcohol dehydrogenase-like predicted oxidoreductase
MMLEELQTDYIDTLLVHADDDADDADGQRRELELARDWMESGRVGSVALGMAKARHLEVLPEGHPVGGVLIPYNAFAREAADAFAVAKAQGMEKIALSPFVRGWKLDEIGEDPAEVSGILLRWVASQDLVDHVIVSMRKSDWVQGNFDAVARGSLTEEEQVRLEGWLARVG